MYEEIRKSARAALLELLDVAALTPGQQVVIGCSSSEIMGQKIGKGSTPEAAKAVVDEILPILKARGLCLEAQCCEHLNRALIMERADAERFGYEIVCVRPRPKAGGSFATAVYEAMDDPVAVEFVKADAGLDIGNTMIGMHLKHVAVPLRLSVKTIGEAPVNACPVGGEPVGKEIAKIMGVEAGKETKKVAFVACQGTCDKAKTDYEYHGIADCAMLSFVPNGGPKSCDYGCTGFGNCVKACPFDAIHVVDGVAVVDKEACKACGKCVAACPKHLISLVPYDAKYLVACSSKAKGPVTMKECSAGCIGCTLCLSLIHI